MAKHTFTVEKGNPGNDGSEAVKVDGIELKSKMLLLKNFNASHPIGVVEKVYEEDGELRVVADVPEEYRDLYPAIGFQVLSQETNEAGVRVITKAKLYCVSLNTSPNVDPSIRKISDQI